MRDFTQGSGGADLDGAIEMMRAGNAGLEKGNANLMEAITASVEARIALQRANNLMKIAVMAQMATLLMALVTLGLLIFLVVAR